MSSPVVIPARSAASIMEELREDFPLAGSRASAAEEVSTAVGVEAFTVAEVTGNSVSSAGKTTYEMENEIMRTQESDHENTSSRPGLTWVAALGALALLVIGISQSESRSEI